MKRLHAHVVEHRHHIIGALILSAAIFAALVLVSWTGMGGIKQNPALLLLGLLVSELGRSVMLFGARIKNLVIEYLGVFVQGLAWWIWSLNLEFMNHLSGSSFKLNLILPALIIGVLPVVAHHGAKHVIELAGWGEEETPKS